MKSYARIVAEHDWMICGELEEFVHICLVTNRMNKISVFFVFVGQQGSLRTLDYGKLAKERRI